MPEKQNIEWKQSWRDEYMKWISGFANAHGGNIFIGKSDNGTVTGLVKYKKLMDDLPNKISSKLGVFCDINLHEEKGLFFIEIIAKPYNNAISYNGKYYYRTGSTNQELSGAELTEFLLKKTGRTWDDVVEPNAKISDLDKDTIEKFKKLTKLSGRHPAIESEEDLSIILDNLRLIEDGKLKRAAILLFGKDPKRFFVSSFVKIGKFGLSDTDLQFQEVIEGNLFQLVEQTIEILNKKYIKNQILYQGIQRVEYPEYPLEAIRETLLNALVHRIYEATPIQISIYDDKIMFWNQGGLPEQLSISDLKTKHSSFPRNPIVADIFFKAGFIESWGRGTVKIIETCLDQGLPEPKIEEITGGVSITLFKDKTALNPKVDLKLTDRQKQTIEFIKKKGLITTSDYEKLFDVSDRTALRHFDELIKLKIIKKIGETKGVHYELNN